jgi:hypothetical protein
MRHKDDIAVDEFANLMKAKLERKRKEGYGGWDDGRLCTIDSLAQLLVKHVRKGDPVDIANFAMMIFRRGDTVGASIQHVAMQSQIDLQLQLAMAQAAADQAWGICDAVAAALGDDLDHDEGSAASVLKLKEQQAQANRDFIDAAKYAIPKSLHPMEGTASNWAWQIRNLGDLYRATACDHDYHYFGDNQFRRCNTCGAIEPAKRIELSDARILEEFKAKVREKPPEYADFPPKIYQVTQDEITAFTRAIIAADRTMQSAVPLTSLGEQVRKAQAEAATWTEERRNNVHLEGASSIVQPVVKQQKLSEAELAAAYKKAFDENAGPSQYRHASNYDSYHRAGLIGVVRAIASDALTAVENALDSIGITGTDQDYVLKTLYNAIHKESQ